MLATTKLILGAATILFASSAAAAQTVYVVDDDGGPGVTHTTISGALAVAGPLDRVDVRPGAYTRFDMTVPTRLMGEAGVVVSGQSRVINMPAGSVALIADMELQALVMGSCSGFVFLDRVTLTDTIYALNISACSDVRARELTCAPPTAAGPGLVLIANSRVQLTSSSIVCGPAPEGVNGQYAVSVGGASFVHLTDTTITGGRGGDYTDASVPGAPGLGGRAINSNGASIRMVQSTITGGGGGLNQTAPLSDAANGAGFQACGGLHDLWATALTGGDEPGNNNAAGPTQVFICGASYGGGSTLPAFVVSSPDFLPGSPSTMTLNSGAGSMLTLILGRIPVNVPVPGSRVPLLVLRNRVAPLGTTGPTGEVVISFMVPPSLSRGTMLFLQGQRDSTISGTEMTNADVIVVR